jgi:hypothetical protein
LVSTVDLLFWELVAKARTGLTFDELERRAVTSENSRILSEHIAARKGVK